jgi:hypothetical protein
MVVPWRLTEAIARWRERRCLRREARRFASLYRGYLRLFNEIQREAREMGLGEAAQRNPGKEGK